VRKKRYEEKSHELKLKSNLWKQQNKEKVSDYTRKYKKDFLLKHQQDQRNELKDLLLSAIGKIKKPQTWERMGQGYGGNLINSSESPNTLESFYKSTIFLST